MIFRAGFFKLSYCPSTFFTEDFSIHSIDIVRPCAWASNVGNPATGGAYGLPVE